MEDSRTQISRHLDELVSALSAPLSDSARGDGWSEAIQAKWLRIFHDLRVSLGSGHDLSDASISRALDHDGVVAGPLLEKAAALSNLVRAFVQVRTSRA